MLNLEDFIAFSSSWPSFCLLPSFMHGMSQLNSNLQDVMDLAPSCRKVSLLVLELAKGEGF